MITAADNILYDVYRRLKIEPHQYDLIWKNIELIVDELASINEKDTINVKTTGTITERLCESILKATVPDTYATLPRHWKWVGDFYIEGIPFNLIISVKSFKAKERLMASGSGNILSPTIGFGLFNDKLEWNYDRVARYPFRAFLSIYMPAQTIKKLEPEVQSFQNMNGKPFIRNLYNFKDDIVKSLDKKKKIDITKF